MNVLRLGAAGILLLAGVSGSANAQILPTPVASTVVNFDDITGAPSSVGPAVPLLDPNMYVNLGVQFTGFGASGGVIFDLSNNGAPTPAISVPNAMTFASIQSTTEGGLAVSPETLTFYPPVTAVQFDSTTVGLNCPTPEILTVSAFAPGGALLESRNVPLPPIVEGTPEGITIAFTAAPPGIGRLVVKAITICALSPQLQLEAFTIDNVAFTAAGSGTGSKCAQSGLDAAGKKAKAVASCYAKALQNGVPVDQACLDKATANFDKAFTKAQAKGDCPTDTDVATVEGEVDQFAANAIQVVAGSNPGPDVCLGKKLTAVGKKAQSVTKCYSKAAQSGASVDQGCGTKAGNSFNGSLKKCGTPTQLGPVELVVDQFAASVSRTITVPTTTTTSTPETTTTSTTMAPPLGAHLSFTTVDGTANCGSNGFSTPADPPFSGELDADVAGTVKLADLGLGCLNIGGGGATILPPSQIPANAVNILDSAGGTTLVASFGTGPRDCSRGPQSTFHCVNDPTLVCSTDADCGGSVGACAADPNCFFGPPIEVNGFLSTCVINTFAQDASGTVDTSTGDSSVNITLASRVYLTIGQPSTCPHCDGGICSWGPNGGSVCTSDNSQGTTLDCPPPPGLFTATLPIDLSPLTTGTVVKTAADGLFCPDQFNPGAFGVAPQNSDPPPPFAQAIKQTGSPGGDLTDGLPHPSVLVSNFCIPATGNGSVDGVADLPGPGSLSLPGNAQFVASPSGAFLN